MTVPALPPIGGYILTGQLDTRHAAHAPVILRHDLTTDFFGVKERAAGWPGFHSFNVFPISASATLPAGRTDSMTAAARPLPPIGGYILTGQLITRQAAHVLVILPHDMTADFFGVAERQAGWPDFRTFRAFPISTQ